MTTQILGGQVKDGDITDVDFAAASKDGAAGVASLRTLGTGANQALPGNTSMGGTLTSPDGSISVTLADLIINQNWANQSSLINGRLDVSVAANALTIAIKTMAGTDPSASNPVHVAFRSSTETSGTHETMRITAAASITLPTGASVGFGAGRAGRLWIVLFNNAGAPVLGVMNCFLLGTFGNSGAIMSLREDNFVSSTLVSAGSILAQTMYTAGSAMTTKPFRIIGYAEWQAGLATPGTWNIGPTRVQNFRQGVQLPGNIVQRLSNYNNTAQTGTLLIPIDNTIPQYSEGNEFLSTTITPNSDANLLQILCLMSGTISVAGYMSGAIFRNAGANAIIAGIFVPGSSNYLTQMTLEYSEIANNNGAAITYAARFGDNIAGTTYINRTPALPVAFGGRFFSCLNVNEFMA